MRRCNRQGCAYILWGSRFNEVIATLFASELRASGLRTWFVGLQGAEHAGRYGVTLVADISLGEALRAPEYMTCLVAPCTADIINRSPDPRLEDLLRKARAHQAVFIAETEQMVATPHLYVQRGNATQPMQTVPSPMAAAAQTLLHDLLEQLHREPATPFVQTPIPARASALFQP